MRVSANQFRAAVGIVALAGLALSTSALAAPVTCLNTANNHMIIDDAQVSSCLDAGTGNITGSNRRDQFMNNGTTGDGYVFAGKTDGSNPFGISFEFEQVQPDGETIGTTSGSFSFDASFWNNAISGAIGFKFGTGNEPDEWFVFELEQGVTKGDFIFNNVFGTGGGLSHVNLYRVPEPSGLVMLGLGVVGAGFVRRRTKAA